MGLKANLTKGTNKTLIGVIGDTSKVLEEEVSAVKAMPKVENVMRILMPYKPTSRYFKIENTIIEVGGIK